ncbi:hypothetical protein CDA63_19910 [Hymenobacter amundsenii]|uniref:DUF2004 domain-containing protein n=1 Tax=Hymenobacter amundsenii TaxID=2006685 RepID=A0A246FFQ1_9BACT|nr:DUF2004 domain-containing protein [Hymenobacter amundsenii]OWP61348.1 hypothetical protein CDA63_19910 [Hymenobacter amundsenii]
MNYLLPYFGEINPAQLEEYYQTTAVVKDLTVNLDLNFEHKTISPEVLRAIEEFLNHLTRWDGHNHAALEQDFAADGETADHITFYFDELDEAELSALLPAETSPDARAFRLLKELKLIRVGFYPDGKYDEEQFATFDYALYLAGEPSNQLLAVKTDEQGKVHHITWES